MTTNVAPKGKLTLTSLNSITTFGYLDLTYAIDGFVLDAGQSVRLERRYSIDATMLRRYNAITKVSAKTINNLEICSDNEMTTFAVGENSNPPTAKPHSKSKSRAPTKQRPAVTSGNDLTSDRYGQITMSPTESPNTISLNLPDTTLEGDDTCSLDIDVQCVANVTSGSRKCSDLTHEQISCEGRPNLLEFLYKGGTCHQSKSLSIQSDALLYCHDFQDDHPTRGIETVFIQITDPDDTSFVVFEVTVSAGESFVVNPNIAGMSNKTRFLIYSSSNTTRSNLIQSLVILSDCTERLSLGDSFASLKLIGFNSVTQGRKTSLIPIQFLYSLRIVGGINTTEIVSLYSITNAGVVTVSFNQPHHSISSTFEDIITFQENARMDTSQPEKFHALTFVQVKITNNHGSRMCSKKHILSFLQ
jgi:hypothetical protein